MKAQELVGRLGEDYNGYEGTILAAEPIANWKKLRTYDFSGWMHEEEFEDEMYEGVEFLVAFEDGEGDINVFTFENGGVDLI